MIIDDVVISCHFHNVGQGLFASGNICKVHNASFSSKELDRVLFRWVYDCGTVSNRNLLKQSIDQYSEQNRMSNDVLGLVTLSHFDADHINGVVDLLRQFEVDVLLLPFISIVQRIDIAIQEGISAENPILLFFLNPVAYLSRSDIRGIRRLVFVPFSGPNGPKLPDDPDLGPDRDVPTWPEGENKTSLRIEMDPLDRNSYDGRAASGGATTGGIGEIGMLAQGSALTIDGLWEFVPYNDQTLELLPSVALVNEVLPLVEGILSEDSVEKKREFLRQLTNLYDDEFGRTSKARNEISLFLYGGPLAPSRWNHTCVSLPIPGISNATSQHIKVRSAGAAIESSNRLALLYCGDGYLNSNTRKKAIEQYLDSARINRIAIFQVMHHGARSNWFDGVATFISPLFSVFSADPGHLRLKHPHREVLIDFLPYGPVLVDRKSDATFLFTATSPKLSLGRTPLIIATELGDRHEIMKMLLSAGADPNIPRSDGKTALAIARERGDREAEGILVAYGATE